MSSKNGHMPLSSVDFLKLADTKRVGRVDLAKVGVDGIVYVCGLSTSQQQRMMGGQAMRVYKDDSRDIAIPKEAAANMLMECMVTDGQDGKYFEAEFGKTEAEFINVPVDKLVYSRDLWKQELGNTKLVREKIQDLPNIVTNHVMAGINRLSGLVDDELEEKKSN